MAGTVTYTPETWGDRYTNRHGYKVTFTWTSNGSGVASGTTDEAYTGLIRTLITNPGSTAPTDDYDVEIRDSNGADLLVGSGADRDQTNSEAVNLSAPALVNDTLTLYVSGAGDSKQGVAIVMIE